MIVIAIIALAVAVLLTIICFVAAIKDDIRCNTFRINNLRTRVTNAEEKLNKLEDYLGIYWKNYSPDFPRYEKKEDV